MKDDDDDDDDNDGADDVGVRDDVFRQRQRQKISVHWNIHFSFSSE